MALDQNTLHGKTDPNGRPRAPQLVEKHARAYYAIFVFCVILSWSPFKALVYLAPALSVAWFILVTGNRATIRRVIQWIVAWSLIIWFHFALDTNFVLSSAFLATITYSTFLLIFAIPSRVLANTRLLQRLIRVAAIVILFQAALGCFQAFYGVTQTGSFDLANGDYVEGTIHPSFAPEGAFANPMFAANMAFLMLAMLPMLALRRERRRELFMAAAVLVLASVVHVILFLGLALIASYLLFGPPLARGVRTPLVAMIVLMSLMSLVLIRSNLATLPLFAQELLLAESPRAAITLIAVSDLPDEHPRMLWTGLGPGQFSSRAALIGSGLYLGGPIESRAAPVIGVNTSTAFEDYLERIWLATASDPFVGSTRKPFYSWLSVYTELGLAAICSVLVISIAFLVKVKRKAKKPGQKWVATSFGAGLMLLLLLGLQENYWEIPQAILVGAMLLKVMYACLVVPGSVAVSSAKTERIHQPSQ